MKMKVQEEGRKEDLREDGWTELGMMSKRSVYRLMKCTTLLHGGVRHRTSTPHKSRNTMNRWECTGA